MASRRRSRLGDRHGDRSRPACPLRARVGRRGRRLERPGEVGQLAGARRAARRAPPCRAPRQPPRRRGPRPPRPQDARLRAARARARRPRRPARRRRPSRRRRPRRRRPRDRRHHRGRARGRRGRSEGRRARRAGPRRRRRAARPELPRRLRRGLGARARRRRHPARLDRPDLPEREPRARARRARGRGGPGLLAVRLARQPSRPRGRGARPRAREPRADRADRRLRRGLPGRPRVRGRRPRGARSRQARAAHGGRAHGGDGARRPLAHRRARERRGGDRCRVPPPRHRARPHAAGADRPRRGPAAIAPARGPAHRGARRRRRPRRGRRPPRAGPPGLASRAPERPAGLGLPALSAAAVAALRAHLPASAAASNPVDLAGGGEQDIRTFDRAARALLECGEGDALLISGYFGGYSEYGEAMARAEASVAEALGETARATGRPLIVHSMFGDTPAAVALRGAGVPAYRTIERAVGTLARLARAGERTPEGIPPLPPPAPALTTAGYAEARALLAEAGVEFVEAATVASAEDAVTVAARLGYPVAVKALGTLHKSDSGGVGLGVPDADALRAPVADLRARLAPPALSVERMAPVGRGVELLVGARRDARFGPVALAGLGGINAEVLSAVAVALAPLDAK